MAKAAKRKRRTPAQRISDLVDANICQHNEIGLCLLRLELLAMEMGWHAEMFHKLGVPHSAASSEKIAVEIEAFCAAMRKENGCNTDIPF